ncbi:hypothetical protein HYS84_03470 [Candidatus Saccharibacteria bacterium]|nr:hypothetical protein [Candidatus Saccharibacteria bacterium]
MNKKQKGFGAVEGLLIIIVLAIIGVVGWIVYNNYHKVPTITSNPKTNSYAILPPATVPSKARLCSDSTEQQVATGLSVNLTCSSGDLNIVAWERAAKAEGGKPVMMTLGYDATASQVCNAYGANFVTGTLASEVYQLAAQYYGWHFTEDPTVAALNGKC